MNDSQELAQDQAIRRLRFTFDQMIQEYQSLHPVAQQIGVGDTLRYVAVAIWQARTVIATLKAEKYQELLSAQLRFYAQFSEFWSQSDLDQQ